MDTKFQTSFIPKKPIVQEEKIHSKVSLFLLISLIVFLVALGLAGYVYLEKNLLIKNIASEQSTIETNKNGLTADSVTVESIVALNSRIEVAKSLLANHVDVSPVFSFLNQRTLTNVRFRNFSFSNAGKDSSGQTKVVVQMSGQARDFATVASQADEFGKPEYTNIVKEPKVSDFSLAQDGSVTFSFSAVILPDFVSYTKNISAGI